MGLVCVNVVVSVFVWCLTLNVILLGLPLAPCQPFVFGTKLRQFKQRFVINVLREQALFGG